MRVLAEKTGLKIQRFAMSWVLRRIGSAPELSQALFALSSFGKSAKKEAKKIKDLIGYLPPGEAVLYSHGAEIQLNAKIGYDRALRGARKEVKTPPIFEKMHIEGEIWCQKLFWVVGKRKRSRLFVRLLPSKLCVRETAI